MYYDKEGKSIELMEWGRLSEDKEYKIIKQENIGKYWISTVWLGLGHNFDDGVPLIFETMVFERKDGKVDFLALDCDRYSTLKEAEEGHKKMVEIWSKK